MSEKTAASFLKRHGMNPDAIDTDKLTQELLKGMKYGLDNETDTLPMIATYLRAEGSITCGKPVIVIDAGGTNYRSALVSFKKGGYEVDHLHKTTMPGTGEPVSWESFVAYVAESIMPIIELADDIAFCFSYQAIATPDIDERVVQMSKQVEIIGAEGQLLGAALRQELERRGIFGKNIVVLNDTCAVLLAGIAAADAANYGGFIGQVSGTGVNACCILPTNRIGKLNSDDGGRIIVNLECGSFGKLPRGEFDEKLDNESVDPGNCRFEKMTAGAYLGELVRITLIAAAQEGFISAKAGEYLRAMGKIDSAVIDAWASGEQLEPFGSEQDGKFAREVSLAIFERSSRCVCACLSAILLLTDEGREKPVCIFAEGSLVQKGKNFSPMLRAMLRDYTGAKLARKTELKVSEETTLPGSAAAALMNGRLKSQ